MGLWADAELSIGIVISCLPVIPRFFQHIGPKLSSALKLRYKSTKDFASRPLSVTPWYKVRAGKLSLPSFKHTFTSVFSHTDRETENELYSQETLPQRDYVQLHEEKVIPRRDATRGLIQMPAAKLATPREDLERAYGIP